MRERLHLQEGWSSLLLFLLILLTMARAFEVSGLAEGLGILWGVVALAAMTGLVLAKVRLPIVLAHVLGLVLGITVCFFLLSTLIELPPELGAGDWLAAGQAKGEVLATRLQMWLGAAVHGESSSDSLPFVAQMAGLSWLIAFYGAWSIFHSHWVWGAVLPAGLAVFLGVYYAPPGLLIYFVAYLLWALMLVVRMNIYHQEREWESHQATYEPYIGLGFLRDGALIAALVVGLVWLLPHPKPAVQLGDAARALEEPWRVVQDEWSRLYASLSYRDQTAKGTFARAMVLSGAVKLGTTPVLEVQAPEAHYWRAVVLDRYTGTGWVDTSPARLRIDAGEALTPVDVYQARTVVTQTVTTMRPAEPLLFAAAEPLSVQLRTDAQALVVPKEGAVLSCISPAQSLGRERRYTVASLTSTASVRRLREAGRDYPAWIVERYLQMPRSLPERVAELAREVAGQESNPYDQAAAIEAYLREMRYNQDIDEPPADVDPVDWFLFDNREGYCTYFASAMVLMCRAVGVPARLAQGYAPGQYVGERSAFVVRENDAHAWPEIYFPSYGWIEFEPTSSRPPLIRPLDEMPGGSRPADPSEPGEARRRRNEDELDRLPDELIPDGAPVRRRPLVERLPWANMALGALLSAAALGVAWRYGSFWSALRPAERLYLRLAWIARPLGVAADPCLTPTEFGAALDEALASGQPLAGQIVELYIRERFAGRQAAPQEIAAAQRAWWRLLLFSLRRSVGRLLKR